MAIVSKKFWRGRQPLRPFLSYAPVPKYNTSPKYFKIVTLVRDEFRQTLCDDAVEVAKNAFLGRRRRRVDLIHLKSFCLRQIIKTRTELHTYWLIKYHESTNKIYNNLISSKKRISLSKLGIYILYTQLQCSLNFDVEILEEKGSIILGWLR